MVKPYEERALAMQIMALCEPSEDSIGKPQAVRTQDFCSHLLISAVQRLSTKHVMIRVGGSE